ncbi:MAG TPA: hypothetical protein VKI19_13430 [Acidimicrobiales bacterium]|nr:hypothetical protein [Acidimicrobiales bacterium]
MAHACPDCAAPLTVISSAGARTLECRSCGGRLYGLSPFERQLADGVGARLWTGAASGSPAGPCPYCSNPMHHSDGDPDAPAVVAVCRLCQEVWVPAAAADWLTAHRAADGSAPTVPTAPPAECSNCGGPFQPDEGGRCHWCHAQITAPQPLLLMLQPEPAVDSGFRLF